MPLLPLAGQLVALCLLILRNFLQLHFQVAAKHDIGSAARHVGGDGNGPRQTGIGDNPGLALVLLGIQDLMLDLLLFE